MPPEIMSECSKQLRLMLPYFSDKTGKGAVFFFSKTMIRSGDTLSTVSLWVCVWVDSLTAIKRWASVKFRRQEGIPSLSRQPLKQKLLYWWRRYPSVRLRHPHMVRDTQKVLETIWKHKKLTQSTVQLFSDVSPPSSPKPSPRSTPYHSCQ